MLSDSWVKKEFAPQDELEIQRQEALLEEMDLDRTEVDKLRKTMLSPSEAIAAKGEELERVRARSRKSDWEEYVDAKRRMGYVMHHSEFLRKLRNVLPELIVTDGRVRNTISMFVWRRNSFFDDLNKEWKSGVVYLGWVHKDLIPEFEIDVVNDIKVPIGQKRGWRTVLLRLMTRREARICKCAASWNRKALCVCPVGRAEKLLTEEQAHKEFGRPTLVNTANGYLKQLYLFRHNII